MMKRLKIGLLLLPFVIIAGIILSGCGGDSGLVKANATKHGISYSFEFPISYEGYNPADFEDTGGDPAISILYREPGSNLPKADKQIYIRPCDPFPDRPDASTWTEEHIKVLENGDPGFELIERSTIKVAGIDGEFLIFYSSVIGNLLNAMNLKGFIWRTNLS